MTARFPDWQLRLEDFVRSRRAMPFQWGANDCAGFAADAVEVITGVRHFADMRGHGTAAQALRQAEALGGLEAIAAQALGDSVPALFARVGDVVLVQMDGRPALGVCGGATVMGPGPGGLVHVPLSKGIVAWRVG